MSTLHEHVFEDLCMPQCADLHDWTFEGERVTGYLFQCGVILLHVQSQHVFVQMFFYRSRVKLWTDVMD